MTDYDPEYIDKFYDPYPKRNGQKKGKSPAFRIWVKMKAGEKLLAINDVAKRNRMNGWGKYIVDCNRYLKDRMWEDEWEPYREDSDMKPNTGAYRAPEPKKEEREFTLPEIRINKAFRDYVFCSIRHGGFPEDKVQAALDEKHDIMDNYVPAFREDVEAGTMTKERAGFEVVELFLTRLDKVCGRELRDVVWEHMRRNA